MKRAKKRAKKVTSQEEGLAPAVAGFNGRGQAPLPDLFYCWICFNLIPLNDSLYAVITYFSDAQAVS